MEVLKANIFYFLSLAWLEEKHHTLRIVLLNIIIPIILSIITSVLTTMLLM